MSKIGVYIAGQPSPFASRLTLRLQEEPEVEIVSAGDDSFRVIEAVNQLSPQVVLLETDLADQPGVDAVKSLKDACPDVSVIVIGAVDRGDAVPETLAAGAPRPATEAIGGDDVVSAILQVISGASVARPDIFEDPGQDRVSQRIARWNDSNLLHWGSPSKTRLKRYNVLISSQRVCPRCYEKRVVKRGNGDSDTRYECSGCGVIFVGAALAGMRIGIAERVSPRG